MSLKKYAKKQDEGDKVPESTVIEILDKNGEKPFSEIYELFMIEFYKNKKNKDETFTEMGLRKVMSRLEKKGDVEKIVSERGMVYRVLQKSKILAEIKGITFMGIFKSGMLIHDEKLLAEFDIKNPIDALMKYFGFYVLGSLLASRMVAEEQRPDWLKHVLNLEEGNKISEYFENIYGVNPEVVTKITEVLQHQYKENYAILDESVKKSLDGYQELDKFNHSKEMVDFSKGVFDSDVGKDEK